MKNIDKYRELIEKEREKARNKVGLVNGVPINCDEIDSCNICEFHTSVEPCASLLLKWLFREAEPAEEPKPTQKSGFMNLAKLIEECDRLVGVIVKKEPVIVLPLLTNILVTYSQKNNISLPVLSKWIHYRLRMAENADISDTYLKRMKECKEEECEQKH